MAVEIEIKAWIRRPRETRALVEKLCVFEKDYVKADAYFIAPAESPLSARAEGRRTTLRVRSENGEWVCTWKEKTLKNALEVNEENEFCVSDGPLLMELLEKLGCLRSLRKVKRGRRYSCRGICVELSEVEGLGLFVEAEKVLEAASPDDIALWEKTLRAFLADIGIRDCDIEERPYSVLLGERRGGE